MSVPRRLLRRICVLESGANGGFSRIVEKTFDLEVDEFPHRVPCPYDWCKEKIVLPNLTSKEMSIKGESNDGVTVRGVSVEHRVDVKKPRTAPKNLHTATMTQTLEYQTIEEAMQEIKEKFLEGELTVNDLVRRYSIPKPEVDEWQSEK